jgi:hypothetical protein
LTGVRTQQVDTRYHFIQENTKDGMIKMDFLEDLIRIDTQIKREYFDRSAASIKDSSSISVGVRFYRPGEVNWSRTGQNDFFSGDNTNHLLTRCINVIIQ